MEILSEFRISRHVSFFKIGPPMSASELFNQDFENGPYLIGICEFEDIVLNLEVIKAKANNQLSSIDFQITVQITLKSL